MTRFEKMESLLRRNKDNANYFFIKVRMEDYPKDELIVNSYNNLESKLNYYKGVYDEYLCHKHAPIVISTYGVINEESKLNTELQDLI